MKQENNLDVITLLRESPELENIPQIQLALSSLNEYTARLLLAEEELDNEYATLVREAEENKTVQELQFDMSSVETPNLDNSTLNLLQSLVIQNHSSSHPAAVSPISFPPDPVSRSLGAPRLSSLSSRTGDGGSNDVAKAVPFKPLPRYTTLSMIPGEKVSGPDTSSGTGSFSPDSASPVRSLVPCSEVAMSESIGTNPTSALNAGASGTSYLTSAGATSAGQDMDGAIGGPASCGKKYDKLSGLKLIGLKLTGLSIQHILNRVATFIDEGNENCNCCICFGAMDIEDSVYLKPCRHRFHKVCINQWIDMPGGVGTTCPMCRNYIVKEEEFPELGAVGKF